jgi:hypothetical protein
MCCLLSEYVLPTSVLVRFANILLDECVHNIDHGAAAGGNLFPATVMLTHPANGGLAL